MVDEKDGQYDEHEEGEYHFSDDQVNYDIEPETHAATDRPITRQRASSSVLMEVIQKRKGMIAGVVFVILLGIVLKILVPSNTPNTQITSIPAASKPAVTAKTEATPAPITQPSPVAQQQPAGIVTVNATNTTPQNLQPVATPTMPIMPTTQPMAVNNISPPQAVVQTATPSPDNKNMQERLSALEQQNAAIMNLLQTEYAQKIADYETQQTAARGKMEELTKRLNRIEDSLNQMTKLLQSSAKNNSGVTEAQVVAAQPMVHPEVPQNTYTVQAIIPGRAWLKSDSGETVTVAEGDLLRDYGRITKIDPYDGIVNIDNGSKIITLSYGTNVG